MKAILLTMFVALLLVGCDGTDRVGRELREGFSRKHNKGSAPLSRQAVLAELKWVRDRNATELKLSSIGSISDLSPLNGLTNLRYLNLYENQNPDITALAGLTNLTELNLGRNKITDLTPLTGLSQLTYLKLWENHVTDLTPLTGLTKLRKLNLYGNPIPDDQKEMLKKALPNCKFGNF